MFHKRDVVTCATSSVFKEKGEAEGRQPWQREGGMDGGLVDTLGRRESSRSSSSAFKVLSFQR